MSNILTDTLKTRLNQLCERCPTIDREQLFADAADFYLGEGAAQFQGPETATPESDRARQELALNDRSTGDTGLLQGDQALFETLMLGGHVESAARAAGMSVRTAYRRLGDPAFREQVETGREAIRDSIVTKLAEAASDAIDCLRELMDADEDPDLRMKSAKALLDGLVKVQNAAPRSSTTVRYTVEQTRDDC